MGSVAVYCCTDEDKNNARAGQPQPVTLRRDRQPAQNPQQPQIIAAAPALAEARKSGRSPKDYKSIKYLGRGFFGCVVLAEEKNNHRRYAMKIIEKSKIQQFNVLQCELIRQIGHPEFLVGIVQTFQNNEYIYIIMEYLPMGDLYFYLRKKEIIFTEVDIRNILAEILMGVALLHKCGIVYRQLKPENLLITEQGHIKLTDYGLSKIIIENRQSVSTFIGTLEYMAPQALHGEYGQKADIWSLGMLMYELMFKENLFENEERRHIDKETFTEKEFIEAKINARIGYMSLSFRDLLLKLLEKNPDSRISLEQMKTHDFFKDVDWNKVQHRLNDPPLKEIVEKYDYIRFRDATAEKYIRREVNKSKTLKDNYQIKLYEFRNSE